MKRFAQVFAVSVLFVCLLCVSKWAHAGVAETAQSGPNFVVKFTDDSNHGQCGVTTCTLRDAVNAANSNADDSIITFDATTFATAKTITLGGTELGITSNTAITGPGANLLSVSGNNASRVFNIGSGTVAISGITVRNGKMAFFGGGIYNNGTLSLQNCIVSSNTTTERGAGVFNNGTLNLQNCTVSSNSINDSVASGGGIYNFGMVTVQNSTISGNSISGDIVRGGAVYNGGTIIVQNSTISGNTASANTVGFGGGVYNGGTLTVQNSTISGNTVSPVSITRGGGILNAGTLNISNSILNQGGGSGVNFFNSGGTLNSLGYNISSDGTGPNNGSTDLVNTDPLLSALANNGGPTQTMSLQATSPAIDAGDPSSTLITDQRGYRRPVNGRSDIGAFEFNSSLNSVPVVATNTGLTVQYTLVALIGNTKLKVTDADNDPITYTLVTAPTKGILRANALALTAGDTFTQADIDNNSLFYTAGSTLGSDSFDFSAADGFGGSVAGTFNISISSGPATHLAVSAPSSTTAGVPFGITVTALDASNNTAINYQGTVHFSSSDGGATLPGDYTFTAGDNSVHTFSSVTLVTAGNQTITATDTNTPSINGTSNITVGAGAPTHLSVNAPSSATAGSAFSVTVTALDAFNNTAISYGGTVHFTSTDGDAGVVLPADYTFVAGDNGIHTFSNGATLVTLGTQSITATDTVTNAITGTSNITITEAPSLIVTTSDDVVSNTDGLTSLREALSYANSHTNGASADEITFDGTVFSTAQTITLGSALPTIADDVKITGPGAALLTVKGTSKTFTLFDVNSINKKSLTLSGLTLNNGQKALNTWGILVATDCVFSGNSTAINTFGTTTVANCTFSGNSLGMFTDGDTAAITNCLFDGNSGGISSGNLTVNTITNCTFSNNTNTALTLSSATGNVTNCTFSSNRYAINSNYRMTIINCTVSSSTNIGIQNFGTATAINCTVSINNFGIFNNSGTFTLKNTICAGNSTNTFGTLVDGGHNITVGTSADAGLDPNGLQDNGGIVKTIALIAGSPAVNAGDNTLLPADAQDVDGDSNTAETLPTDSRGNGFARIIGGTVDIGAYEAPLITLSIAPTFSDTFAENAGAGATKVRITREGRDLSGALVLNLRSSDTSEATIASTATILAGDSYVDVPVNAVDDTLIDGTQTVLIKATAAGYLNQKVTLNVTDNDPVQSNLSLRLLPSAFSEAKTGTAATLVVQHDRASTATAVTVNLSSTDARLNLPATAQIPVGKRSVEVALTVTADSILTGTKNATITATATNFTTANTTATIYDAQARITLSLAPSQSNTISEGAANNQTTLRVTRNTPTAGALVVNLSLNKGAGQVSYSSSVTIPDGVAYADFIVSSVDDSAVDGTQSVVVVASATGYGSSTAQLYVRDNDGPGAMSTFKAPDEPSK